MTRRVRMTRQPPALARIAELERVYADEYHWCRVSNGSAGRWKVPSMRPMSGTR
jgi:hypothetical protein